MTSDALIFTGILVREGKQFYALCPELDVSSHGSTIRETKSMLRDAVSGYLEICFESNLPYMRSVPADEDPRTCDVANVVETFPLRVNLMVKVHA